MHKRKWCNNTVLLLGLKLEKIICKSQQCERSCYEKNQCSNSKILNKYLSKIEVKILNVAYTTNDSLSKKCFAEEAKWRKDWKEDLEKLKTLSDTTPLRKKILILALRLMSDNRKKALGAKKNELCKGCDRYRNKGSLKCDVNFETHHVNDVVETLELLKDKKVSTSAIIRKTLQTSVMLPKIEHKAFHDRLRDLNAKPKNK